MWKPLDPLKHAVAEIRIAIIGFGKIAIDQHVPAITSDSRFKLVAAVSRGPVDHPGVSLFSDAEEMLRATEIDAVAICTPAAPRHTLARQCLEAGKHVLLEKPPCSTLGEVADLESIAAAHGRTLFTTWHAQYNEAVEMAAAIAHHEGVSFMRIEWMEDVRKWHPDQDWIWRPGGFGVFDAGINALSIATKLIRQPLLVREACFGLEVNQEQPIAARLLLSTGAGSGCFPARFDWRHSGDERWTINVKTDVGTELILSDGGAVLHMNGRCVCERQGAEYPAVYTRFADLARTNASLVDSEPLRIVADAFLIAKRGAAAGLAGEVRKRPVGTYKNGERSSGP
jgi:D-galactose 1-dehydrogenase